MTKKIPANATKVFSGVLSDIYHWPQEMYDGSFETFEAIRFTDGAFVIGVVGDQIIITHQEQPAHDPFIGLPGGGFDTRDEDPLACAKREFLEETGYRSDQWEHWMTSEGTNNVIAYTHFYIARGAYQIQDIRLDPGERISIELVSFDGFLELAGNPRFVNWTIERELFFARLSKEKYAALKMRIFGK